jgi:hypothetical protein
MRADHTVCVAHAEKDDLNWKLEAGSWKLESSNWQLAAAS